MFDPENYQIIAKLFPRLLGLIYFIAFAPFILQIKGLIGENGILPVENFLRSLKINCGNKAYYYAPSIFWLNSSDTALMAVTVAGTILSLLLFLFGYPIILLPIIYVLYFSIVAVGQDFLSFGWELFLLEITINTIFLTWTESPNPLIWISLNILLFRFHIQAGAVKLQSKDKNWRNLTAISFHYLTQPIPNTIAWFAHKLPMWFHKLSCLCIFAVELIVPFGMFFGEEVRLGVFLCFAGVQFFIWLTGNFSYLNYLTVAFSTLLLSDRYLEPIFGISTITQPDSTPITIFLSLIGGSFLFLQVIQLWHHFIPNRIFYNILHAIYPLHICCRYGIFAVMTTKRFEIVVEGSNDGIEWREYTFKHKSSEIERRPRRISPYQPRLDWQAWFLPFSDYHQNYWFQNFLTRLLQGSPVVLKLLRDNPFPKKPPLYVRAVAYDYTYSDFGDQTNWWKRSYVGEYSPIIHLKNRDV